MPGRLFAPMLLLCFLWNEARAQLSGMVTVPGTYSTIASALSSLNAAGVSAHFSIQVATGYTETAPTGGYTISATGTPAAHITIHRQGTGSNPVVYAYAGNKTPGAASQDGVFRLIGCDYVTLDGIDIVDLNTANPATMEFGYGLFKVDSSDGCHHVTIRNCAVTLNRVNNAGGAGPAADGSRGIDMVNAAVSAHNASLAVTSSPGAHAFNLFENNVISNCNTGISLYGNNLNSVNSLCDLSNKVLGNTIINFGGGGTANAATGIRCFAQELVEIRDNLINNVPMYGPLHAATLRGIQVLGAGAFNTIVSGNTITLQSGASGSQLVCIDQSSGNGTGTNTVTIAGNVVTGCTYDASTSGSFYGIWNSGDPMLLQIRGNLFHNNSTGASSGSTYLLYNNGDPLLTTVHENTLAFRFNGSLPYSGTMYGIYNSSAAASATVDISRNVFRDVTHVNQSGTGNIYLINNSAPCIQLTADSNMVHDLALMHQANVYCIFSGASTASLLAIRSNTITNIARSSSAFDFFGVYAASATAAGATHVITGNFVGNLADVTGGPGDLAGIYDAAGNTSPFPRKVVSNNTVMNIQSLATGNFHGVYVTDLGHGTGNAGSVIEENRVETCSHAGPLYGLYVGSPVSPSFAAQIRGNRVTDLEGTSSSDDSFGAYLTSANAGAQFSGNRISQIHASGPQAAAYGLYSGATSTTSIFNNLIGHIYAPASNGANRSNGIYVSGGSVRLACNSIYLQMVPTGTNASSNALYASSSASVHLRNNILINKSGSTGPGVAAAFRRSNSTLSTYDLASDNNLFYAGSGVLFYNGSSYSTLGAFQALVSPRESASLSADLPFLSLSPYSPSYLHLPVTLTTVAESSGAVVSVTDVDIDGELRFGHVNYTGSGTAPDIGADETGQNLNPCSGTPPPYSVVPGKLVKCAGSTFTLSASGSAGGTGLSHHWEISATSGSNYSVLPVSAPDYSSPVLPAGTYYLKFVVTCTNNNQQTSSPEATVVIRAFPTPTAISQNATVCIGATLDLSVSGGSAASYHWFGPGGFTAWGQTVSLSPAKLVMSGAYSVVASQDGCYGASSPVMISVKEVSLSLQAGKQFLCSGDSTLLQVTGNVPTFSWNPVASGNSLVVNPAMTSVYTVTGTDAWGCSASKQITLTVLAPTIAAVNATVCGPQTAATLAVNAFTPSTVHWYSDPGGSVLTATGSVHTLSASSTSTFYARAHGSCSSSLIPVTLLVAQKPVLSAQINPNAVCAGQSLSIIVTGAANYSWTGASGGSVAVVKPVIASDYTVRGSNMSGCTGSLVVSVTPVPLPVINVSPSSASVCHAAKTTFTAQGAQSFTWNTGTVAQVVTVSPLSDGTHTVFGTSMEGCIGTGTAAIFVKSLPFISVAQSADTVCPGQPVLLHAQGGTSYTWMPGNSGNATHTVFPVMNSVYSVVGMGVNSCTQVGVAYVEVLECAALKETGSSEFIVFPNPSDGIFHVLFRRPGSRQFLITDPSGQCLSARSGEGKDYQLDLGSQAAGVYLLRVDEETNTSTILLIRR